MRHTVCVLALSAIFLGCGDTAKLSHVQPPVPQVKPGLPVAVISALSSFNYPTPSVVDLDGTESYDEDGRIVGYEWSIVDALAGAPPPETDGHSPGHARLLAALAGEYTVQLVVVDDEGRRSEPATATFFADAVEDIHVEMIWNYNHNDVDLHLVRPGGKMATSDDCYYNSCIASTPDWGVSGDDSDDPSLDIDNIAGVTPENINLDQPESGTYRVIANYYRDHGQGSADVSVRVFVHGALAGEFGPVRLDASCDYWEVASISMPTGVVDPGAGVIQGSSPSCAPSTIVW